MHIIMSGESVPECCYDNHYDKHFVTVTVYVPGARKAFLDDQSGRTSTSLLPHDEHLKWRRMAGKRVSGRKRRITSSMGMTASA
jgi:hypothetical protein